MLYGRAMLLVRVRMFDGPGVVDGADRPSQPATRTSIPTCGPATARDLAFRLLECAEHAERVTEQAGCGNDDPRCR